MLKHLFIITLSVSLFIGCSPQKRLTTLLNSHPELIEAQDTIHILDTVVYPSEVVEKYIQISALCPDLYDTADNKTGVSLETTGARADITAINDSTIIKVITENKLTKIQKYIISIGYVAIGLSILIIIIFIILTIVR